MSLFRCPLCAAPLQRTDRAYRCPQGHSFDIAAEGHTHLLPVNQKNSKMPGDDKGMAAARSAFLSEGYYTAGICHALREAGKSVRMAGTDISKFILKRAAKRERSIEFAVASSYHLPVHDGSIDLLINCFSPLALEEFLRVLKPGGRFLYVVPSERHLWQLKEVLYDQPRPNEVKLTPYEGLRYLEVAQVRDTITVRGQDRIHALFQMTPYYWKTPKAGAERLSQLDTLTTEIAFDIHVYEKA